MPSPESFPAVIACTKASRSIAVTERPILFFDFKQIEEDVLAPEPNRERLINDPAYFLAVSGIFTFTNINPNQWHRIFPPRVLYTCICTYTKYYLHMPVTSQTV